MEEDRALLPYQEAAILLEYARDGKLIFYIQVRIQMLMANPWLELRYTTAQDLNGSMLTLRSRLCYRVRHKVMK